jgi:hypothetical protein
VIEDFQLGQQMVVKVGVGQGIDHFFFDIEFVINEVVVAKTFVGALSDKMHICPIANSKGMDSCFLVRMLSNKVDDLVSVVHSSICKQ